MLVVDNEEKVMYDASDTLGADATPLFPCILFVPRSWSRWYRARTWSRTETSLWPRRTKTNNYVVEPPSEHARKIESVWPLYQRLGSDWLKCLQSIVLRLSKRCLMAWWCSWRLASMLRGTMSIRTKAYRTTNIRRPEWTSSWLTLPRGTLCTSTTWWSTSRKCTPRSMLWVVTSSRPDKRPTSLSLGWTLSEWGWVLDQSAPLRRWNGCTSCSTLAMISPGTGIVGGYQALKMFTMITASLHSNPPLGTIGYHWV